MRNYQKLGLWSLRLGLALTYLYSGPSLILSPESWLGFLPPWFAGILPVAPETYLQIQGAVEILLALSFLTGFGITWAALISAAEFFGILVFHGIDLISFRDIAILGSSLALFFFCLQKYESR